MGKDTSKPRMILVVGGENAEDTIRLGDVELRVFGQLGIFAQAVDFFPARSVGVAKGIGARSHDGSVLGVEFGLPDVDLAG